MPRRKLWSRVVVESGVEVRVFERRARGPIWRELKLGRVVSASGSAYTQKDRRSLGHADKELALEQARELAAHLADAHANPGRTGLHLGQLFAAYRRERLPNLTPPRARESETRMAVFTEAWGRAFHVQDMSQSHVDAYCRRRRSLELVAPAFRPDADGKHRRGYRAPQPVRDGALHSEISWLSTCLNWATRHKVNGRRLLDKNPLHDCTWPKEKNPRRPIASHQRFTATLAHADAVDAGGRLGCILQLARYTGRREGAICALTAADLLLSETRIRGALAAAGMDERTAAHMPHGAIRWSAQSDKEGFLFVTPISRAVRTALDDYLHTNPRVGAVPLFPAPGRKPKKGASPPPEQPIGRDTAAKWLRRAERLAGLPKLAGGTFHPYRRLWATERKHMPDADVAASGGWRDTRALKTSYQHADAATTLRVVEYMGG
jgi:hypothetical protein